VTLLDVLNFPDLYHFYPVCKENGVWAVYHAAVNEFEILDTQDLPRHFEKAEDCDPIYTTSDNWKLIDPNYLLQSMIREWPNILELVNYHNKFFYT
jgi:hypothetical protein